MVPRRAQTPITFRSDRAATKLAALKRTTGRSQAEIIEDALDRIPDPHSLTSLTGEAAAQYQRIMAIARSIPPGTFLSMKEADALEFDENGDFR